MEIAVERSNLRGFGPLGVLAIFVILFAGTAWISAVLVLVWAKWSGTPWSDIGYVRPKSWAASTAVGVVLGVAMKLTMKAIVMPLFGADSINRAYHYVAGNRAVLPAMLFAVTVGAGFGEETVFRGFLFERLRKLFGAGKTSAAATVVITSAWFGAVHYPDQGLAGVQQATVVGLVLGTIYAKTGRIWMLMVAHSAFDLTALAMIYWDVETVFAHLLFK